MRTFRILGLGFRVSPPNLKLKTQNGFINPEVICPITP
jgi:hypothetical protein